MALNYTVDQVRQRELSYVGQQGPSHTGGTPWWGLADPTTNDCVGFQLFCLGLRSRTEYAPHVVSIAAFRAWAGWDEVAIGDIQPGDLLAEEWPDSGKPITGLPGHLEYVYSTTADAVTIISANTGPQVGYPRPRGVWKKTRTRTPNLLFGIRPPYVDPKPSRGRIGDVKAVGAYLNRDAVWPPTARMPKTAAADDGIEGPVYWTLVQEWGRAHHLYGPTFHVDGIPGPRSRAVEAAILKLAKQS